MRHYVTLFDAAYLPQGLALYESMSRVMNEFCLWVISVDDETYAILTKLQLADVRVLRPSDFESPLLRTLRSERTVGEYCWTLTPFAPRIVFDQDESVDIVTYLDADLWFRADPSPIFEEFDASKKSVLVTEHDFSPQYDASEDVGIFCVQFMPFRRGDSEIVRQWWEDRCVEWCFARVEDGKFGDQKYLDSWPSLFPREVHILRNRELLLAPWNSLKNPYAKSVVFHFHGVRIGKRRISNISGHKIPRIVRRRVYIPYFQDLRRGLARLEQIGFNHYPQKKPIAVLRLAKSLLRGVLSSWTFLFESFIPRPFGYSRRRNQTLSTPIQRLQEKAEKL